MKTLILSLTLLLSFTLLEAQETITGIVYNNGEPTSGIKVSGKKSGSYQINEWDGVYTLTLDSRDTELYFETWEGKSSRKTISIEDLRKQDFNFAMDGNLPSEGPAVVEKTASQLEAEVDREFLQTRSLFQGKYGGRDYKGAVVYWKHLYEKYPMSSPNVYINGVDMYKNLMDGVGKTEYFQYVDTIMTIYDKRLKYYENDKANILERKAADYLSLMMMGTYLSDPREVYPKAFNMLEEAIQLRGANPTPAALLMFMGCASNMCQNGQYEKEGVNMIYGMSIGYLDQMLKEDPNNEELLIARSGVDVYFKQSGAADCDAMVEFAKEKLQREGETTDVLKEIYQSLDGCDDSPFFLEVLEKLYKLEPSPVLASVVAGKMLHLGNETKAITYFENAARLGDAEMKVKSYRAIATLYLSRKDYQSAVRYVNVGLATLPRSGELNILMGDIYGSAVSSFDGDDFQKQTIYWLAVDYFEKAKSDSKTRSKADERIKNYSAHFPSVEDLHFRSLREGDSYTIGGWINKATTVRKRK